MVQPTETFEVAESVPSADCMLLTLWRSTSHSSPRIPSKIEQRFCLPLSALEQVATASNSFGEGQEPLQLDRRSFAVGYSFPKSIFEGSGGLLIKRVGSGHHVSEAVMTGQGDAVGTCKVARTKAAMRGS